MKILLVEDNENLSRMLSHNLALEGYEVVVAADGATAIGHLRTDAFALVLLDLMIPPPDGVTVLRTLREQGNEVPVIVLTAKGDASDKLRGLRLGADDYITKPFDLLELLARVAAVLRRSHRAPQPAPAAAPLAIGHVTIDPTTHTVRRDGEPVHLRPREYEVLLALIQRAGALATRHELLSQVWGYRPDVVSRTLDTHIGELRRKLERDPAHPELILTVRKAGFRIAMPAAPAGPRR
jgi:DNA-binding response OmpR family regulator